MINLASIREQLEKGEVDGIEWVSTKDQLADVFTKEGVNKEPLREYVGGGECCVTREI
jgi:hypothetical protein